jgi:SAM-dependent methyltransferase
MTDIYQDGKYKESNPTWHEHDAPWKARKVQAILADNRVPFETMCEVGCGTGEILVQLSEAFPDAVFTGYDISPQALELAAARERNRVSFHLDDPLGKPDIRFDVALVADVIEHVEDCFAFVRKVKDLASTKVFHIPLDLSVQSVLRMWPIMNLRAGVGHIHYFTKDTALALLTDCGYKIIDWRYTASRLELPDQARSSRIIAPLRRAAHKAKPDLAVRLLGGYSLLVLAE